MAAPSPWPRHRARGLALAVAVSLASILALLATARQSPAQLGESLARLGPLAVALALALHGSLYLAWAARLKLLAGAVGIRVPYAEMLQGVLAGSFAASITPAMIGGEAVRGYVLARRAEQVGEAGAAILAERLLDFTFFAAGGAAFAVLYGSLLQGPLRLALAAMAALLGLGLAVLLLAAARPGLVRAWCARFAARLARRDDAQRERWRRRAEVEFDRFRAGLRVLARKPLPLLAAGGLTAAMWVAELGALYVILRGFGAALPFGLVLVAGMLLLLAMATPLVPGGSGIAEVGAVAIFGTLAPGVHPLFVAVWRGCTFYANLLVGGLAAARMWPRAGSPAEPAPLAE